jgi:hypothetical protein
VFRRAVKYVERFSALRALEGMPRRLLPRLSALLALALCLVAGLVQAAEPLIVTISAPDAVDETAIRSAIEAELGRPIAAEGEGEILDIVIGEKDIEARFHDARGRTLERRIGRPRNDADLPGTVALLAGNVARNEADEILAALTREEPEDEQPQEAPPEDALPEDALPEDALPEDALPEAAPPEREKSERARPKKKKKKTPKRRVAIAKPVPEVAPRDDGDDDDDDDDDDNDVPTSTVDGPDHHPDLVSSHVQLSAVYPGALWHDADARSVWLDIGMFYGHVGRLRGIGLHGGVSTTRERMSGAQFVGLWAHHGDGFGGAVFAGIGTSSRGERHRGVVGSGLMNLQLDGSLRGAQMAGIFNLAPDTKGLQIAGNVNVVGELDGLQIAGNVNVGRDLDGVQIAGNVNVAGDVKGAQFAGNANSAHDVKGLQISDGANVASAVDGSQIGLVNVGGRVRGAQIGLVNVADEVEGVQLGLLSLGERVQAITWAGIDGMGNVGVKSVSGYLHAITAFGYHPDPEDSFVEPQVYVGAHVPIDPVYIEVDAGYGYRVDTATGAERTHVLRCRAALGWQFHDYVGAFLHGGLRYQPIEDAYAPEAGAGMVFF